MWIIIYNFVKISGPFFVIKTVSSNCADFLPSFVTYKYPSSPSVISQEPAFTIGSIAKTIPSFKESEYPEFPKEGIKGKS